MGQEFRNQWLHSYCKMSTWRVPAKLTLILTFSNSLKKTKKIQKALQSFTFSVQNWEFYAEPYVKKISSVNICKQLYFDIDLLISICTVLERQRIEDPARY